MASTQYVYTMHKLKKAWPGAKEVLKEISACPFCQVQKLVFWGLMGLVNPHC